MTKNIDVDKYNYSGDGIGFDRKGFFSVGNGVSKNVIIFGVDMSLSPHIDEFISIQFWVKVPHKD